MGVAGVCDSGDGCDDRSSLAWVRHVLHRVDFYFSLRRVYFTRNFYYLLDARMYRIDVDSVFYCCHNYRTAVGYTVK